MPKRLFVRDSQSCHVHFKSVNGELFYAIVLRDTAFVICHLKKKKKQSATTKYFWCWDLTMLPGIFLDLCQCVLVVVVGQVTSLYNFT